MVRKSAKRITQAFIGTAIVCFLIGIGNIIFGRIKWSDYRDIMIQATAEMNPERQPVHSLWKRSSPFLPGPNMDKQARYIARIQQRLEFYEFVMLGGKFFLAFSFVILLAALLFRKSGDNAETD